METKEFKQTKKQTLDSLIIRGEEVINDEEKQWEWFKLCVEYIDKESSAYKYILNESLEIMKDLQNLEMNVVAEKFLNKSYEHNFAMHILNIVFKFSNKGLKFVEVVAGEDFSNYVTNEIKTRK